MYQVIRTIPASLLFQHEEVKEIVSEHKYRITAWFSWLIHHSIWVPCHVKKRNKRCGDIPLGECTTDCEGNINKCSALTK